MLYDRLLQRFLRYVRIDTTARDGLDVYPSCDGQWTLGRLLADELRALGLDDVDQDSHGLVWATLPANGSRTSPVLALNAHLDTSPETTGAGVQPQVVANYQGGDLVLPGDPTRIIRVAENPELGRLIGTTLVTSDGTTLLGGDDKAGIAVIMESVATLVERPDILHGPLRILFTCDEEIGRGVEHVDFRKLGADVCYTLDGGGAAEIDVETFSADLAVVSVHGANIHPSMAKDRMVNAVRGAAEFIARLPRWTRSPERTEGTAGFLHPYTVSGGVAEVSIRILLRSFETPELAAFADWLRSLAQQVEADFPGIRVAVDIRPQYRNMRDGLSREPRAVRYAQLAHERLGRTPRLSRVRGGTDGSQFTARGLPTPNLSTGQHNPHSPLEWVCLEEMRQAQEVLLQLAQIWYEQPD
ncbi:MAG: peptidase T [Pirellulaceae bacterium]